jgi:hypothetical protein
VCPVPPRCPLLGTSGNLLRFIADPLRDLDRLFQVYGPLVALVRGRSTRLVSTDPHVPCTIFVLGPELNRRLFSEHELFHESALSGPLYPAEITPRTRPLARTLD